MNIDSVNADNVGTTANTPETIGTIILNKDAERVIGFMFQVTGSATVTSAEANVGSIIVTSADLDLVDYEITAPRAVGGAPATNVAPSIPRLQKQPVMKSGDFGSTRITFQYNTENPEPTEDAAAQVFVVYDDGSTPQDVVDAWLMGYLPFPVLNARSANDDEIGDAVSETMDDTITIDGKYETVNGYTCNLAPDALATDDEHLLGHIEVTGTIPKLTPLHLPIPAINPELGTSVGAAVSPEPVEMAMYIPKGSARETFTLTVVLQAVTTGANAVQCSFNAK